jgi:DNA-damage-inducible protein J
MTQMNISIDDSLREEGIRLFDKLGVSFSTAVSMFVQQAVREQAMPFEFSAHELTLAAEEALSKEWLSHKEDSAWANL